MSYQDPGYPSFIVPIFWVYFMGKGEQYTGNPSGVKLAGLLIWVAVLIVRLFTCVACTSV